MSASSTAAPARRADPSVAAPHPSAVGARRPALQALTGLRFVAAMWVVLFHVAGLAPTNPVGLLVSRGYVGVPLFFVLSGFILAYTYLDVDAGALRGSTRAFLWARVARIYPVYLLSLAVALPEYLRALGAPGTHRSGIRDQLAALPLAPVLLQGWWPPAACVWNCPGWSLSVEAFFYLLFPALGIWLVRRPARALPAAAALWAASLALPVAYLVFAPDGPLTTQAAVDHAFWRDALMFNPIPHLSDFVLGIAVGVTFVGTTWTAGRRRAVHALAAGAAAIGVALLALVRGVPDVLLHTGLTAPLFALVVLALALGGGAVGSVLATRPLVRLGEASYALYLLHFPLHVYLERAMPALLQRLGVPPTTPHLWPVEILFGIGVYVGASLVVFRAVEEPARRAIRAAVQRSRPGVPAPAA